MNDNAFAHRERVQARRLTYKSISGGTLMVCIGLLLLLNTTGRLSWGIWLDLMLLWPILLVSIGMRMLFVATPFHFLSLTGPVLIAAATLWAATGEEGRLWRWRQELALNEPVSFSCPAVELERPGHLDLGFEAGTLRLVSAPSAAGARGFAGTMRWAGGEPRRGCGSSGDLRLGRPDWESHIHFAPPFSDIRQRWETEVSSTAPVDLNVRLAAADAELDLRAFVLTDVDVKTAASNIVIHLGAPHGRVPVRIDGGVSRIELKIPEGTCFSVTRDKVLGLLDVEDAREEGRRPTRVVAEACDGSDKERYDISYEVPLSSVSVLPEPTAL